MRKVFLVIFLLFSFNISAQKVEDFNLPIYNKSEIFKLSDSLIKYDKVYLNFWASWCTACIQEMDELEALKIKYANKNILFVAINAGEKKKKIKRFLKKRSFSYLILEDSDRELSRKLGVTELPRSIIIDKKGNILYSSDKPPKDL
ncbi:TlpA disulfide reductase family protein [Halobacteriovorax sp. RZ-1]|uniref:TlpA disulfide reductase family protein n=1 Tax=unclassified Halobacteriovorax TaxID=2639665 RepID=UPI0037158879